MSIGELWRMAHPFLRACLKRWSIRIRILVDKENGEWKNDTI